MQLQQCRPEQTKGQAEPVVVDMERGKETIYVIQSLQVLKPIRCGDTKSQDKSQFLGRKWCHYSGLKLKNE